MGQIVGAALVSHHPGLMLSAEMRKARGGEACRYAGTPLSAYENAGGTGNIHIWFELPRADAAAA